MIPNLPFTVLVSGVRFLCAAVFASLLVIGTGCQASKSVKSVPEASSTPPEIVLTAGDVVRISVPGSPDLDATQRIQADGKLNLPLVGEVKAAGKSLAQLQLELKIKYSTQVRDATVIVNLDTTASVVYVLGAVSSPGKVPLNRSLTVYDAILEAGGFAPSANRSRAKLTRRVGDSYKTEVIDPAKKLIYVSPFDVIEVQQGIL
jgi:polysaccharide biosynthesis/export protein